MAGTNLGEWLKATKVLCRNQNTEEHKNALVDRLKRYWQDIQIGRTMK